MRAATGSDEAGKLQQVAAKQARAKTGKDGCEMVELIQRLSLILVGLNLATALAHALELPGKLRLSEAEYRVVQRIYYPGFTWAGSVAEPGSVIGTLLLLLVTPTDRGLAALAFAAAASASAVYWAAIHPVNKTWVKGIPLAAGGARFFATGRGVAAAPDFKRLRNRWEYGHVARAASLLASLIALLLVG